MRYSSLLALLFALPFPHHVYAFPQYGSLAGLTAKQLALVLPTLHTRPIIPPPGPLNDTSTKLVNDHQHPYIPPGPSDIRGPCPAMNTLANHGYIPRNGIARPSEIVAGAQEAFNMGNDLAKSLVYGNHLLNGNMVTDLMSIGEKTPLTGIDPPPCTVGGLNDHTTFEGDASMTRADIYFGDSHSFNETYFQQFVHASGGPDGVYDKQVSMDLRYQRYKDSMATNPTFDYSAIRYFGAISEAIFPYIFFVDGRVSDQRLDMNTARSFFEFGRMPRDFYRANHSLSGPEHAQQCVEFIDDLPEVKVGKNNGTAVDSFIVDPTFEPVLEMCKGYKDFANLIGLVYQSVTSELRDAVKTNLHYFYGGFVLGNCTEVFPLGK